MINKLNFLCTLLILNLLRELHCEEIYEKFHPVCEYKNEIFSQEDQIIQVSSKIWQIPGENANIIFSPCGKPIDLTFGCDKNAVVCIKNDKNPQQSVLNAGLNFAYIEDEEGQFVLKSTSGQPCSSSENYTVILQFDCYQNIPIMPKLLYKDECEYRIRMRSHKCVPKCTIQRNGELLDFRALQRWNSVTVYESSLQKTFIFSLCKAAKECSNNNDVSVCDVITNDKIPISDVISQKVSYDENSNKFKISGHHGTGRKKRSFELDIKCNWEVEGLSKVKYKKPIRPGNTFKFQAESSLACVKLPMDCQIRDGLKKYIVYDLNNLNKPNQGWTVKNVTEGNIKMNLCGLLYISSFKNRCSDQSSQVCLKNRIGDFINLGSIPANSHVTTEDTVKISFKDGSTCLENETLTYSTDIEFICSDNESGPILERIQGCEYKIRWATPRACPKQVPIEDNCVFSDLTGNINLQELNLERDRTYPLSTNSYLRYSLCGELKKPCNNKHGSTICYVQNGQEYVVGLSQKLVNRQNGLINFKLMGENCRNNEQSSTQIFLRCNYEAPIEGKVQVQMIKDGCTFRIDVHTPLACPPATFAECKFSVDNILYDLSKLTSNTSNYEIHDEKATYFINVCRSVISGENNYCSPYTGVCMNDKTEPHIKRKYVSLGRANSGSKPKIENGNLVLLYQQGSFCLEAESLYQTTLIRFICSPQEERPILVKKEKCHHEFLWRTPHACPKTIRSIQTREISAACNYTDPRTKKTLKLDEVNTKLVLKMAERSYHFEICRNYYKVCSVDGLQCSPEIPSNLIISEDTLGPYLEYPINSSCNSNLTANKLRIHLLCNKLQDVDGHVEATGINDCIYNVNLNTNLTCVEEIPENIKSTEKPVIEVNNHQTQLNYSTNEFKKDYVNQCSIKDNRTNKELRLKDLETIKITSSDGNDYVFSLSKPSDICESYICKNGAKVVTKIQDCPIVYFNYSGLYVNVIYTDFISSCGDYKSEIHLKCKSSDEEPQIIMDVPCKIVISYPIADVCPLLPKSEEKSNTAAISIGISVPLLLISLVVIFRVIRHKRKKTHPLLSNRRNGSKTFTKIYYKDSTM